MIARSLQPASSVTRWNRSAHKEEFLAIYRQNKNSNYEIPKGRREAGECLQETAFRELAEESGLELRQTDGIPRAEIRRGVGRGRRVALPVR